jgi:hypothetical protein
MALDIFPRRPSLDMNSVTATLERVLDRLVPGVADSFYRVHAGFQDPVGVGRRLIADENAVMACTDELLAAHHDLDVGRLVIDLLDTVPPLPEPVDVDYSSFRNAKPFPPHLVCYALAYVKKNPEPRFVAPVTRLMVRTGWWAGDENCVDDLLDMLPRSEIVRTAAESVAHPSSAKSLFAAGQLLYHLRYGEDDGLRGYVKHQYELALQVSTDPEERREIRARLESGLKPWITISSRKRR